MKKILLWTFAAAVAITVLVAAAGIYKFNILQDDIFFDASAVTAQDLVGQWVEPIPGQEPDTQGFELLADGTARSINMATLQYKSWRLENGTLYLVAESIGNATSSTDEEAYAIDTVGKSELNVRFYGQERRFRRP